MLALCDRGAGDLRMPRVGRRDDDRLHVVPLHDLFVFRRGDVDAGLLTRALQGCLVGVAERDDFGFGTQRKARKMILQRNAAATDDGDADLFHDNKVSREYDQVSGKDKRCCPKGAKSASSVPSERRADSRVRPVPEARRFARTKLSALLTDTLVSQRPR